jgi:hypothetical protein
VEDAGKRGKLCYLGHTDPTGTSRQLTLREFADFNIAYPFLGHALLKPEVLELPEFGCILEERLEKFDFEIAEVFLTGLISSRYARLFMEDYQPPQGKGKGFFMGADAMYTSLTVIRVG